ncbi:hypothetical protein RRG08_054427 [Elysia crispata]|uniref:Uncharacterized protein n=1 Tax=Elysia crispata TaxID=231223 RepID=A0AAE1E6M6_9GAST|nr:hypothetical protein RRG08_054427 [Elysia crispata]
MEFQVLLPGAPSIPLTSPGRLLPLHGHSIIMERLAARSNTRGRLRLSAFEIRLQYLEMRTVPTASG